MEHANPAAIVLILLFTGPVLFSVWQARQGKVVFIRKIAGIEAIQNAIGRAVEMGRPISFTSGLTGVTPRLYACLSVLSHVARQAARFNSRILVPASDPEALALTEATLQNAYRSEKRLSKYDPTCLRFLSEEQFAFASGYMGMIHRERVAAAFLFGRFAAESLVLAEAGQGVGAIQIAATDSPEQIPFFITACDYTLIGEELYAAGAYLTEDRGQRGSLRGQDIAKAFLLGILVLGILESTCRALGLWNVGQPLLSKFLECSWEDLAGWL